MELIKTIEDMEEFKGTKGKWEADQRNPFETTITCGRVRVAEAKHFNSGEEDDTFCNDPELEEGIANANLIAKAPELLSALQQLAKEINLNGLNVKKDKDFSLMVAHANALKVIHKTLNFPTNQDQD